MGNTIFRKIAILAALVTAAAATYVITTSSSDRESAAEEPFSPAAMTAPAFLSPGDKIAILTPSYATDSVKIEKAVELIRGWGYEPVLGPNVGKRFAKAYAGTVEERLSDIRWALENPEIKAIICQRGGYGALHFIGDLMPWEFARNPKWIVGYSDITTLLSLAACGGVMSVHGVMGNDIASAEGADTSCIMLRDLLAGNIPSYSVPDHPANIRGRCTGKLVGGNICTFAPLAGTSSDFTAEDGIVLFIEEIEESYHNIDRQLNILLKHGLLERVNGVILGDFSGCRNDLDYPSVEALIASYFEGRGIPVCCGFPAGHGGVNWPLIMGAEVSLRVGRDGAQIEFNL